MKTIWHISRILLGLVFIFSGFVKGIDPLGVAYKFTDYFNVWGMELLTPFALPLGVLLSASEFIIGIALVLNIFISLSSIAALLFMGFFTGVTFLVALQNPVSDCGCFGDALILTNWQTFYKNIFFLAFALIIFLFQRKFKPKQNQLIAPIMATVTIVVFAYLIDYSYKHLPFIDFRPYKIGVNITEGMQIPDNAAQDIYENTFQYKNKKSGKIEQFTQENYPWRDSLNWEYISMESELIQKGYEAPIHNFLIETQDGEDIKDFFLYDEGYTFLFIAYDLDKADRSKINKTNELAEYALNNGMNFIGLTSSLPEGISNFVEENNIPFEIFNCDETTLKTIVRSNPGLLLLKKGTIKDKWHYNDIPTIEEFEKQLDYFKQINI